MYRLFPVVAKSNYLLCSTKIREYLHYVLRSFDKMRAKKHKQASSQMVSAEIEKFSDGSRDS